MVIVGADFLVGLAGQAGFSAKMVFNEHGAIVFAAKLQHREQKVEGISYEDDYGGNALAAMLSAGRIEIRFHRDFSDRRVAGIVRGLLATPELAIMRGWVVTYQGRTVR